MLLKRQRSFSENLMPFEKPESDINKIEIENNVKHSNKNKDISNKDLKKIANSFSGAK